MIILTHWQYIDGLVQERRNSSALAMANYKAEVCLFFYKTVGF